MVLHVPLMPNFVRQNQRSWGSGTVIMPLSRKQAPTLSAPPPPLMSLENGLTSHQLRRGREMFADSRTNPQFLSAYQNKHVLLFNWYINCHQYGGYVLYAGVSCLLKMRFRHALPG